MYDLIVINVIYGTMTFNMKKKTALTMVIFRQLRLYEESLWTTCATGEKKNQK